LRQATPDAAQAEACFEQALAIAHHQQAKSWELRAALSLSRLWQQQGKPAAARQLLADMYGWFTSSNGIRGVQAHDNATHLALVQHKRTDNFGDQGIAETLSSGHSLTG